MSVVLVLLSLLAAACGRSSTAAPPHAAPPSVDVVAVVRQRLQVTERLPAELAAWEAVAIYPKVRGFVADIPVDRGSIVQRGALLVRLTAPELAARTARAAARLAAHRATFDRLRAAARTPGAVAPNEVEVARQAVAADAARVRSLKALVGYLTVSAPFDGVITERDVHPGALVGPPAEPLASAVPLLRLERIGRLRLTVPVPEADAGAVVAGAPVQFQVPAFPGRSFDAVIRRLAHRLDQRTRTMAVEADVDNVEGALAPGMFAEVRWPVDRTAPSFFVPASAVVESAAAVFVERVRSGKIEHVPVTRGREMNGLLEVFGPLAAADVVVAHATDDLADGTAVGTRLVPAPRT